MTLMTEYIVLQVLHHLMAQPMTMSATQLEIRRSKRMGRVYAEQPLTQQECGHGLVPVVFSTSRDMPRSRIQSASGSPQAVSPPKSRLAKSFSFFLRMKSDLFR